MKEEVNVFEQIAKIKTKIKDLQKEIDEQRKLLKSIADATHLDANPETPISNIAKKETLEETIVSILSDGLPRSTRQLMDEFNEKTGRNLTMPDFTSRIIGMQRRPSCAIRTHKSALGPNLVGLKEWFHLKKLKPEYLEKKK